MAGTVVGVIEKGSWARGGWGGKKEFRKRAKTSILRKGINRQPSGREQVQDGGGRIVA